MTTIKAVADYAGVSVATVSRVMNRSGYVSHDLELRVQEAMATLHFRPSALAQGLRNQRTLTVGVLIPQIDQPFFSALTFAMEKSLFASGYHALICSAEENLEKENTYVEMLLRQRVDGIVIAPTGQSAEHVMRFVERNVPVVLVDRDLPELDGINRVLVDNYQGAYEGMRYLLALGHRRIAVVGASTYIESIQSRLNGAVQALEDAGIPLDRELLVIEVQPDFELGFNAGMILLSRKSRPTAIFALTDMMAVGVIHAAAKAKLDVPEDVSVIGFDNIPLAPYTIPALTTVAQPIYQIGEVTAAMLLRHMEQEYAEIESVTLQAALVRRNSACPPRNASA
jgi:DNA-binding LacI/PurR family transcriptional regulator